jgi:hypothetical protein
VGNEELAREERAAELREEIERLRSGEGTDEPPKTPREFAEEAAREAAEGEEAGEEPD